MFGVPDGFVTIDFCVTCAADYALKSQVLAGLPGNYTLYSIQRQSEQITHSHRTTRASERRKENKENLITIWRQPRQQTHPSLDRLPVLSNVGGFPRWSDCSRFLRVVDSSASHCIYRDIRPTKKCLYISAYSMKRLIKINKRESWWQPWWFQTQQIQSLMIIVKGIWCKTGCN